MDFIKTKLIKTIAIIFLILPNIGMAHSHVGPVHLKALFPIYLDCLNPCLHGFYAGATTAVTSTTITNKLRFNSSDVEDAFLYNRNQFGSNTIVQPGFVLGYEHVFKNVWLVSGEFQANFLRSPINFSGTEYISNVVSSDNQYALQFRGGFSSTLDNDNIVYGLIGVVYTQTNVKIIFNNAVPIEGMLSDLQMSPVNKTNYLTGLKLGVGYEKRFYRYLALRFDYSHVFYDTFHNSLIDSVFFDVLGPLGSSNIKQSTDMLSVTLMFLV